MGRGCRAPPPHADGRRETVLGYDEMRNPMAVAHNGNARHHAILVDQLPRAKHAARPCAHWQALDAWAELILLGGYAAASQDPQGSGAWPRGAILYDASTVAQAFEGPFFADLRAFNAVVSYAAKLAEQGTPVTGVTIR